jgi:hypothetical protein
MTTLVLTECWCWVSSIASNTTGTRNAAHGFSALLGNTTGIGNTANGHAALYSNTTGGKNIAVGFIAGAYITDGVTLILSLIILYF